jgi:hypothetical protein
VPRPGCPRDLLNRMEYFISLRLPELYMSERAHGEHSD